MKPKNQPRRQLIFLTSTIALACYFLVACPRVRADLQDQYHPNNFFLYRINIDKKEYNQQVVGKLSVIIHEFVGSLEAMHLAFEPVYRLYNGSEQLVDRARWFKTSGCEPRKKDSARCLEVIKQIYQEVRALDQVVLSLQALELSDASPMLPVPASDMTPEADELSNTSFHLLHLLERMLIEYSTGEKGLREDTNYLLNDIQQYSIWVQFLLFRGIPHDLQDTFLFVWSNFFKKFRKTVFQNNTYAILENNLEEINFSWNHFQVTLTKGQYKLPSSFSRVMVDIQNRWNAILKILFR